MQRIFNVERSTASKRLHRAAMCAFVGGLGFTATWLTQGDKIASDRPLPAATALEMTEPAATRPVKDDLLSSLPPQSAPTPAERPVVMATKLPIPPVVHKGTGSRKVAAAPIAETASFERCLPACETRDSLAYANRPRMIQPATVNAPEPVVLPEDETVETSLLDRGSDIVSATASATHRALRIGRSAMFAVVSAVK